MTIDNYVRNLGAAADIILDTNGLASVSSTYLLPKICSTGQERREEAEPCGS
jgi:hypothetical protein